jgi:BlaI family transcriptional regulator, penicillinase repressor
MVKPKTHRLGDLQLRIMRILWKNTEASVSDVHAGLGGTNKFAYTTIATMLRKMEARGLVAHREEGRTFIYKARIAEETVSRRMADDLLQKLFGGSLTLAVNHLLSSREVSNEELRELERLIAERKKKS